MRHTSSPAQQRRGAVTVIVVAFLALFAVLGLTFLIASQRFATSTRLTREAMNRERDTPPQPDVLMQKVMADILFDTPDDATGVYKATRGWSFGRLMYGQNPSVSNTLPYSGIGRKRDNLIPNPIAAKLGIPAGSPDYGMLNYQYFPINLVNGVPDGTSDGFVRDPEFVGPQGGFRIVSSPGSPIDFTNAPRGGADYYWPINANYTSADENNPYLAVIDPTSGRVILPSFHRPGTGPGFFGSLDKTNPNWANKIGKYLTFRPRPNEHSASFPFPKANTDGTFGDVENLENKAGGVVQYDSLWMDMDLPVSYWRGKRYKPLVALLITDLDSRINLNTAGNLRNGVKANGLSHGANQNWGPWEVNLGNILNYDPNDTSRLFNGSLNTVGRYGGATITGTAAYPAVGPYTKRFASYADELLDYNPAGGNLPHFYAPVDFDGGVALLPAQTWQLPRGGDSNSQIPYEMFPVYGPQTPLSPTGPFSSLTPYAPNNRYWNGRTDGEAMPIYSERLNHPSLYNPYLNPFKATSPATAQNWTDSKTFTPSEMVALNAKYMPPSNAVHPVFGSKFPDSYTGVLRSDAAKLTSLGLTGNALNRFRVTTISNDVDLPGGTPWMHANAGNPFVPPTFSNNYPYVTGTQPHNFDATMGGGDFDFNRKQSLAGVLGTVDLNRPLADYRDPSKMGLPYTEANLGSATQVAQAISDRQNFAADIYLRLRAATGTPEPSALTPGSPEFTAAQLLAQLAVNIVDYIDHDDYVTPFNWNVPSGGAPVPAPADNQGNLQAASTTQYWVFGHELPRLVINEAMARLENDPLEPDLMNPPPGNKNRVPKLPYKMRIWTELHNPLTPRDANEVGQLADGGQARLVSSGASGAPYPIYRMRLAKGSKSVINALINPANPGGEPPAAELLVPNPATLNTSVLPASGTANVYVAPNLIPSLPAQVIGYKDTNPANPSFYIVGPKGDAPAANSMPKLPDGTAVTASGQFENMEFSVQAGVELTEPNVVISNPISSPIIVLQRLANEHQPPGPNNPYVTVDTFMPANYTQPASANLSAANSVNPVSIVQDRVQITPTIDRIKGMTVPQYSTISSFGKREPYLSYMHLPTPASDTTYKQQPSEFMGATQMRHTFTRHNGKDANGANNGPNDTLNRPFTTMTHLDRPVTGPAELLNVSQFGTHMVGQLYYNVPAVSSQQLYKANWLSDTTGLYRAFDLLSTHRKFHGQGENGRTPGLVNLNTLVDREVFNSLMDYQHLSNPGMMIPGTNGKHYTQPDVDQLWNALLTIRNINPMSLTTSLQAGTSTRPLLGTMSPLIQPGAGDPQYPNGMGSAFTLPGLIASLPNASLSTGLPPDRIRQEMLETLQPNVTTRSNTFAVYATFGFFEVLNDGTGTDRLDYSIVRPQLGAEVIGVDGKPVRYKFFSVIDRTQLSVDTSTNLQGIGNVHFSYEPVAFGPPPTLPPSNPVNIGGPDPQPNGSAIYVTVAIPRTAFTGGVASGSYDGIAWKLKTGDQLMLDGFPDAGVGPGVISPNLMIPNTPVNSTRNRVEIVNVAQVADEPAKGRALVTFAISKPHSRGANLRLLKPDSVAFPFGTQPGNAGQQSGSFNLGANTYKTVIPVFERIDGY